MTYKETTWEPPAAAPETPVPEPATADQVLEYAADLIKRHGWVQGMRHTAGGYCVLGALEAAVDDLDAWSVAHEVQDRIARRVFTEFYRLPPPPQRRLPSSMIWEWNDSLGSFRGRRKVLKALRSA